MPEAIPYTDTALLQLVKQGDEQAFSQLYLQYYQVLRPFIWKLTQSTEDSEEIIQNTFLRVWLYRDKLDEIQNFRAWIFKVASRENLNYLRKKLKLQRPVPVNEKAFTPADLLQASEIKTLIAQAVEQLPSQRRKIFQMSRNQGLTATEISEHLSISEKTVHNSLTTALRQIREYLGSAGYHLPILFLFFEKNF